MSETLQPEKDDTRDIELHALDGFVRSIEDARAELLKSDTEAEKLAAQIYVKDLATQIADITGNDYAEAIKAGLDLALNQMQLDLMEAARRT